VRKTRRHRRSEAPSVSIATYQQFIQLVATTGGTNVTVMTDNIFPNVENEGGETTNRKILRVSGSLCFAASMPADRALGALFCLRAAPELDAWPTVADFDPFNSGPTDNPGAYKGRMSPRPFGRRMFALATPAGGGVTEVITQQFRYSTKAERLLRPGWRLDMGLYVRGSNPGMEVKVAGSLSVVVAG